ncbi:amino acid permease [Candidatus Omnitrophota bacterium]
MASKRFGTFEGVFTPCFLSLLGVIMYLRLGWVVGSVGLGGAVIIIILANLITLATALSMSSVVTNIRIGAGGAYSIIAKSLGIEAGGAIGVPLYVSQAISIAFYIAGFAECWHIVFPAHSFLVTSLVLWLLLFIISTVSAKLAFRIQYIVMALIVASLFSIIFGAMSANNTVHLWEGFSAGNFWKVFAIFFPAVTGILAGATMSGELIEPKKSIPHGTLTAIGMTAAIYLLLAFLFTKSVSLSVLQNNLSIALDIGRWRILVIAGILGATLSSALAMFVGAPRVLLALGKHAVVPGASFFGKVGRNQEPTRAILLTAVIVLVTILCGSLNKIASLLTLFFLITYGIINLTVFIEQSIGIISFRPSFRVPRFISLFGALSCGCVMLLIDVRFSVIAIAVIVVLYILLLSREAHFYSPDIRSGLLVTLAENFSKLAAELPYYPKIWKPNLIMPVNNYVRLNKVLPFIRALVLPAGRCTFFEVMDDARKKQVLFLEQSEEKINEKVQTWIERRYKYLNACIKPLKDENLFVETTVAEAEDIGLGTVTVIQTLRGKFFAPNTFFYLLGEDDSVDDRSRFVIEKATLEGLGVIVLCLHKQKEFAQQRQLNLWVRQKSPNMNLAILIALQLMNNWEGQLRILQVVDQEFERAQGEEYFAKLKELMRLPQEVDMTVMVGSFNDVIKNAPAADINMFGMQEKPDVALIRSLAVQIDTSVLFLRDSSHESALA